MMTKKHFTALAAVIATITDPKERKSVALGVGLVCKQANPAFGFPRFYTACGVAE